ncbi:hypothetical protein SDC9_134197 [bioreactor metagenome]|uniref:Uncharacterized protein n=1 Tax=bioreactor metagenome TaxID=1076179 RepID=A0A645DCI7_9ZZZZ
MQRVNHIAVGVLCAHAQHMPAILIHHIEGRRVLVGQGGKVPGPAQRARRHLRKSGNAAALRQCRDS